MEVEATVETNVQCPLCKFMMPMTKVDNKTYLRCQTRGCGYYNVRFKLPTVLLEVTEEGKELLIERSIIDKEW